MRIPIFCKTESVCSVTFFFFDCIFLHSCTIISFFLFVQGPVAYNFNYDVKDDYTGSTFGHQESRDGYNTQGSYYSPLPDGRLQKVTYYVNGDSGFVAEVMYEGEAQYPTYQPASVPAYQPAPSPAYQPAPLHQPVSNYA